MPSLHVAYSQQGDKTRDIDSKMAVITWIQISLECQKRAQQAGHSDAQIQNGYFRQSQFLLQVREETPRHDRPPIPFLQPNPQHKIKIITIYT
jgi:hypothetical protein